MKKHLYMRVWDSFIDIVLRIKNEGIQNDELSKNSYLYKLYTLFILCLVRLRHPTDNS